MGKPEKKKFIKENKKNFFLQMTKREATWIRAPRRYFAGVLFCPGKPGEKKKNEKFFLQKKKISKKYPTKIRA